MLNGDGGHAAGINGTQEGFHTMSIRKMSLGWMAGLLLATSMTAGAAELTGWVREDKDYPQHQGLQYFFDRLKATTQGKFSGKVACCEELGKQKDVQPKFEKGDIDVVLFDAGVLEQAVPELRILNLPFLFRDADQMTHALNGEVGKEMDNLLEKQGVHVLAWYDGGARSFYSKNKNLSYASDFNGLKVRVPNRKDLLAMVKALGAEPSTIAFDKIQAAMKSGELDVAENDLTSYYTSEHYKFAPYFTFSNHLARPIALLVSNKLWSSLTANDKAIFERAAAESAAYAAKTRAQRDADMRAKLEKEGVKFAPYRSSATTISLMKEAYAPVAASPKATELMVKIMTGDLKYK